MPIGILKNKYAAVIAVIVIVLFILFFFKPAPIAAGDCIAACTYSSVFYSEEEFYNINGNPCPNGCGAIEIKHYVDIDKYGWSIKCECCRCVGSQSAGLGECNYPIGQIFNPLGQWLGLCRMRG